MTSRDRARHRVPRRWRPTGSTARRWPRWPSRTGRCSSARTRISIASRTESDPEPRVPNPESRAPAYFFRCRKTLSKSGGPSRTSAIVTVRACSKGRPSARGDRRRAGGARCGGTRRRGAIIAAMLDSASASCVSSKYGRMLVATTRSNGLPSRRSVTMSRRSALSARAPRRRDAHASSSGGRPASVRSRPRRSPARAARSTRGSRRGA